jgi:hypothetical protein
MGRMRGTQDKLRIFGFGFSFLILAIENLKSKIENVRKGECRD